MNRKIFTAFLLTGILFLSNLSFASAETASTTANVKKSAQVTKLIAKADKEIERRLAALEILAKRVEEMKKVSDTQKTIYVAAIQKEKDSLNALKTKIDAETDIASLRTDVKSITEAYRVFALIIPQIHILAASDRMTALTVSFAAIGQKLTLRLNDAKAQGKDISSLKVFADDFNAKLADARTQAEAAQNHVISLVPDNGDEAVKKSNTEALKLSRADIKTGQEDFRSMRKDVDEILKGLNATSTPATATTTPVKR